MRVPASEHHPRVLRFANGGTPVDFTAPPGLTGVLAVPDGEPVPDAGQVIRDALCFPVGMPPLAEWIQGAERVGLLVPSDLPASCASLMIEEVLNLIEPGVRASQIHILVATGGSQMKNFAALQLSDRLFQHYEFSLHRPEDEESLIDLGSTTLGTGVTVNREVASCDRLIVLGEIRPHHSAGYTGGAQAVFPGAGGRDSIRHNQSLAGHPTARLGQVDGNIVRMDMEEVLEFLPSAFLLNVVLCGDGRLHAAAAGDPIAAHREGAGYAHDVFSIPVDRQADVVIASDGPLRSASVASLLPGLAPAAWLLRKNGCIILVAPCAQGLGDVETVNRVLFEWSLSNYLPDGAKVFLVSSLPAETVRQTFLIPQPSIEAAYKTALGRVGRTPDVLAVPDRAGDLVPRIEEIELAM